MRDGTIGERRLWVDGPWSARAHDEWAQRWWGQTQMRIRGSETRVEEMTGD